MADANCIPLSPEGTYYHREALSASSSFGPGALVDLDGSGNVIPHASADTKPAVVRVADISIGDAGDIGRSYVTGETVNYLEMNNGAKVTLVVAASQTIAVGGELASDGLGFVKSPAVAGTGVVAIANEAVTTGVGQSAFISATIVNF